MRRKLRALQQHCDATVWFWRKPAVRWSKVNHRASGPSSDSVKNIERRINVIAARSLFMQKGASSLRNGPALALPSLSFRSVPLLGLGGLSHCQRAVTASYREGSGRFSVPMLHLPIGRTAVGLHITGQHPVADHSGPRESTGTVETHPIKNLKFAKPFRITNGREYRRRAPKRSPTSRSWSGELEFRKDRYDRRHCGSGHRSRPPAPAANLTKLASPD